MNIKLEALAFRIWQAAEPLGWNLTRRDLAEMLDEPTRRIAWAVIEKGWGSRLRAHVTDRAKNRRTAIMAPMGSTFR